MNTLHIPFCVTYLLALAVMAEISILDILPSLAKPMPHVPLIEGWFEIGKSRQKIALHYLSSLWYLPCPL